MTDHSFPDDGSKGNLSSKEPSQPVKELTKKKRKNGVLCEAEAGEKQETYRDCTQLYACRETVHCALHSGCVPCAYKVGCFDVALDTEFRSKVPNQRPEQCPRMTNVTARPRCTMGYQQGMPILTVGDGDFSFSLAIARMLSSDNSHTTKQHLVATSYETIETLRGVYPNLDRTLNQLRALGVTVCFQVDATRLTETLPEHAVTVNGHKLKFQRIIFNFPCTAITSGRDGQNQEMDKNKELIRRFVVSSHQFLHHEGELHVAHKTKPPYNQWRLEEAIAQACVGKDFSLQFPGRVVLDRALLPTNAQDKYTPRKALDRKSFPCHDACFYIFGNESDSDKDTNDNTPCTEERKFPPTIPAETETENSGNDCSADIVPVTEKLLRLIRSKHLATGQRKRQRLRLKHPARKRK